MPPTSGMSSRPRSANQRIYVVRCGQWHRSLLLRCPGVLQGPCQAMPDAAHPAAPGLARPLGPAAGRRPAPWSPGRAERLSGGSPWPRAAALSAARDAVPGRLWGPVPRSGAAGRRVGAWAEHQGQEQPQAHPDDDEPPRERGRGVLPEPAPRRHRKDHRPRGSAQRLPGAASRLAPTVTPRREG